jgi:hypothetical protein
MGPPGDDRRPRQEAPPPTTTTNETKYARTSRQDSRSTHPGFCLHDVLARRRASRQLDAVLCDLYPPVERRPSTFGLTESELRRHANDLHADGWHVEEIRLVLDIEPAS